MVVVVASVAGVGSCGGVGFYRRSDVVCNFIDSVSNLDISRQPRLARKGHAMTQGGSRVAEKEKSGLPNG